MDVLRIILTVLEVIASVLLIVVVLAQSGKEAGLSGAIAGNSDSFMSKNKRGNLDQVDRPGMGPADSGTEPAPHCLINEEKRP